MEKKTKKVLKIVGFSVLGIVLAAIIFVVVYLVKYSQGVIENKLYNDWSTDNKKVLIASQGSDFKKALTSKLVQRLGENVYIKVTDVTNIGKVKEEMWDAIVIINTIEMYKLQADVKKFLDRIEDSSKVVLLATSGEGDMGTREEINVDVITSASNIDDVNKRFRAIKKRLEEILKIRI